MPPSGDSADEGGVSTSDVLWNDCVRWLGTCGALPSTVIVNDLRDFALVLRDGVVLCRLANALEPGCITDTAAGSTLSSSQFVSNRYISKFIDACVNRFGLNRADVFTTEELWKMENFGKVLRTLSLLSHTEQGLKLCEEAFPPAESPTSSRSFAPDYYNNEAIYQCLQTVPDEDDVEENIYDMGNAVADEERKKHGDIYDTIVVSQRPNRHKTADFWDNFHPTNKREHCIKELLDTEINYVDNALGMIINKYQCALRPHLSSQQSEIIFMNIAEIFHIHHNFRTDLKQAVYAAVHLEEKPGVKDIGAVFLEHKEKFVVYGKYCASMNNSRTLIDELWRTEINFKRILEDCRNTLQAHFQLQDLMCVPMQRILKYHMLLKQLIDSTPVDSPDRKSLDEAHEAMQDINGYINEVKRDYEAQQLVAVIQKSIPDLEMPTNMRLTDYGRLIKDGEIKMAYQKDGGKLKSRYIFIFDKVMLVCKLQRNNLYSYKNAHILKEFVVEMENENNNRINTITRKFATTGSYPFCLNKIMHPSRLNENGVPGSDSIQFMCKTLNHRHAWVAAFDEAHNRVMPQEAKINHHKVSYKTFPAATTCSCCKKLLHGLYFQGYYCENCKSTLHRECLKYTCNAGRSRSTPGPILHHRTSDLGARMRSMNGSNFGQELEGTTVVAKEAISSMDPMVLCFEKHDRIDVVKILDGGTFMGRLVSAPGKTGIVKADSVKMMRQASHSMSVTGLSNHLPNSSSSSIQRHESTVLPRPIQPAHRMSSSSFTSTHSAQRDYYVNMSVSNQPWYFGPLSRDVVESKLFRKPNGTFIVRFSPNHNHYAISISYMNEVKHTRVEFEDGKYYLDESKQFDSLVELVNYYREKNLSESFELIDTVLTLPYIQSSVYRVVHEYTPTDSKYLTLRQGELVTVLDTSGEERGWWKGQIDNRIGFFPFAYVAAYFEDDDSSPETGSL